MAPYIIEAGVDIELLHLNRRMVVQGLLWYFVINKRKLELEDIGKGYILSEKNVSIVPKIFALHFCYLFFLTGMNTVSLQQFLMKPPSLLNIVFPPNSARQIASSQLMSKITFESNGNREKEEKTKRMFEQYVEEIATPKEGN